MTDTFPQCGCFIHSKVRCDLSLAIYKVVCKGLKSVEMVLLVSVV